MTFVLDYGCFINKIKCISVQKSVPRYFFNVNITKGKQELKSDKEDKVT